MRLCVGLFIATSCEMHIMIMLRYVGADGSYSHGGPIWNQHMEPHLQRLLLGQARTAVLGMSGSLLSHPKPDVNELFTN